jgi:hypothetical protein
MGQVAIFSPIIALCVPVIRDNQWMGSATGTLNLKGVLEIILPYCSDKVAALTLTDPQGRIIACSAPERAPMPSVSMKVIHGPLEKLV